jgi:hypothetical protein
MTPEQLAKPGTEHAHQVALFCWISYQIHKWPELKWMFAIPNGGERNPVVAARLKAEGVKSGVSDLCLPVSRLGYHGLYIEMKKPKGKESENQIEYGAFLAEQGYFYRCCDHWDKAAKLIEWYMT